jgi:transposase-like protein
MVDDLFSHALLLLGLLWLCVILSWVGRRRQAVTDQARGHPANRATRRSQDPKPFLGLTIKPRCGACEPGPSKPPPTAPPPRLYFPSGRPRTVATHHHFCPEPTCRYYGWVGRGNIRANGHPSSGRWQQLQCVACGTYFLETHGTPLHGTRVAPELVVWAVSALAEGLGIRAVARVFEVDPNTALGWLVEAADHLQTFSRHFLHDVHVTQVQLDELFALLSAVKDGEVTEIDAIQRLSRSPHWVWVAMDPVTKLMLTINVGERSLAMAQCVVHQVAQVLAPDCVLLFLTEGFKEDTTALLTHFGQWVHPPRRQVPGPVQKPSWMPLPELLYAQVVK